MIPNDSYILGVTSLYNLPFSILGYTQWLDSNEENIVKWCDVIFMIRFQKTDFCLPSTTLSIAFSACFFFFFFWGQGAAPCSCRNLVLPPRIELWPSAVRTWSSNRGTTRKFLQLVCFVKASCDAEEAHTARNWEWPLAQQLRSLAQEPAGNWILPTTMCDLRAGSCSCWAFIGLMPSGHFGYNLWEILSWGLS